MSGNGRFHLDLSADGLDGQWVDLVDVGTRSPRQFRALKELPQDPAALAALGPEEARAAGRQFLALCVSSWSVLDPETGEQLPAPNSPALDPDVIPTIVTARISAEVRQRMEEIANLKARSASG